MLMLKILGTLLGASLLLADGRARAEQPQRTTATYNDWTAVCVTTAQEPNICELVHTQIIQGQTEPVGQIVISPPSKRVVIQTPPSIWFSSGANFVFDDNEPKITITFQWCTNARCLAEAELSTAALAKLRTRTEPGRVEYKDASERDISIPVSFNGFASALSWIEKQ